MGCKGSALKIKRKELEREERRNDDVMTQDKFDTIFLI